MQFFVTHIDSANGVCDDHERHYAPVNLLTNLFCFKVVIIRPFWMVSEVLCRRVEFMSGALVFVDRRCCSKAWRACVVFCLDFSLKPDSSKVVVGSRSRVNYTDRITFPNRTADGDNSSLIRHTDIQGSTKQLCTPQVTAFAIWNSKTCHDTLSHCFISVRWSDCGGLLSDRDGTIITRGFLVVRGPVGRWNFA